MTVFVDTSALFALLDRDDQMHDAAALSFPRLLDTGSLLTHNYVVVETTALAQRRLGLGAVRALTTALLPAMSVTWVTPDLHAAATAALLAAGGRRASLVDWVSFEVMRQQGISTAFAFDADFAAQGFSTV